jgi:hypothetical protein
MPLPTVTKTWIISPNNRITFTSLNDTMSRYLFGIKTFLVANGYTVIGSSNGTTAGVDAVDRWTTFNNATTRGATAAAAQSWIVLRDGNGADMLLAYQGSVDNAARISFSPGQLFVAAGTPTFQPTAADEQVVSNGLDLIGATASVDRIWNGWVSSDAKFCRFAVARAGVWTGRPWGIENYTPTLVAPAATANPVWGFSLTPAAFTYGAVAAGVTRVTVSAVPFNCSAFFGTEIFANDPSYLSGEKSVLQGQSLIFPLAIGSATAGARGKLGNLIDQWIGRTDAEDGTYYGALELISMTGYRGSGGVWPWNGSSVPLMY